ncbi:MAG TPA: hypothetical protein VGI43_10205 [Mucilaginibacter sp.]|jgi:hypothetical protein
MTKIKNSISEGKKEENSGSLSNKSLQGTFVGTGTGTLPASFAGGDPNVSLPITMLFQYTFDGDGHIDPAFGEATIGGQPMGLIKATGTYHIDPATGIGEETINLPASVGGGTINRRFALSNGNTQLHLVGLDPGFQFQATMYKQ